MHLSVLLFYQRINPIYTCNICDSILTESMMLIASSQAKELYQKHPVESEKRHHVENCGFPSKNNVHSLTKLPCFQPPRRDLESTDCMESQDLA